MTYDTSTLLGSLDECADRMANNLTAKGVTASFNEDLLTLAYKISQIPSSSSEFIWKDEENRYTKTSSNSVAYPVNENVKLLLPSKCEIGFEIKTTGGTSSNEHRFFLQPCSTYVAGGGQPSYGLYFEQRGSGTGRCGYRSGSTQQVGGTFTFTTNSFHKCKIVKDGSSCKYYFDNNLIGTGNPSWFGNYTEFGFYYCLWNSGTMTIRNEYIKIL